MYKTIKNNLLTFFFCTFSLIMVAQTTNVGNASYTNSHPGRDSAGRNDFPSGSPQLTGNAIGKPVPTNDWWSTLVKENHADNLFNYPMTMKTTDTGLIVTYIPWGVIGDNQAIEVGLTGLSTTKATVSDYSDWTVTMNWKDAENVKKKWGGTFCLKGIMSKEDAKRAIDIGADAIMISNHGGRQLDGSASPFDQLEEIADYVSGKIEIICDGGIRRGTTKGCVGHNSSQPCSRRPSCQ